MNESDVLQLRLTLSDRYRLLKPIATGGMAEIFLARQKALAGFEKDVAVKLLRDRYRGDPRVVEMFLNEARIGAVLNHANIVHVYDVGEHDKQPFIAMEYIHGEELSQLCRRGLELARFLPLEHAVDLVRQAAEALGYFHAKRDDSGHPLEIVHRDISPSNLLITQDGALKVIDFGIARATWADRNESEAADKLVPGKYNYMSPEQVRGERVDRRSDIFSLGIVLYEITVGKRLFKGRPEEVMQKVTRGRIKPPTFIRRQFPPALERIVMRALESHRDDRYNTAYELASDLEEFLRDSGLKSGPMRIAQYLDELRTAEGGDRRPELIIAGEMWLDDDGEEALDFDRGFSLSPPKEQRPSARAPVREHEGQRPNSSPVPLADSAEPAPVPVAPVPVAPVPVAVDVEEAPPLAVAPQTLSAPAIAEADNDDDDLLLRVAAETPASETRPLRAVPRGDDGEELTNVQGLRGVLASPAIAVGDEGIDPDLGENIPTDASMVLPDMSEPAVEAQDRPQSAPIVLSEPTGRVPLTVVTGRVPLLAPLPAQTAAGTGTVPLVKDPGRNIPVPLRAEPTGQVTLAPTAVTPAASTLHRSLLGPGARLERAAAEAARLAALDPVSSIDTPLPAVPDPLSYDTTERHPLADLDGLVAASGMRLLKAEVPAPRAEAPPAPTTEDSPDPRSVTMEAGPAQPGPVSLRSHGRKKSKQRPRYRPRSTSLANLEIQPDPVPPPSFGEGLVQTQRKRNGLPWPLIIGAVLALLLIVLLMTR